ncbi:MAG: hypothetical protein SF097_03810 [Acidobacteriota bacterium]|nr:hypothetical protein [Acidobacteriota bacterium]
MTQEQMENAMNFIVEQQAKFSIDLDRMKESHEQRMKEIEAVQTVHQELMEQLTEASLNAFKAIAELSKAQKQTDKKLSETDDRLNILINVVESHINNHNGKH